MTILLVQHKVHPNIYEFVPITLESNTGQKLRDEMNFRGYVRYIYIFPER